MHYELLISVGGPRIGGMPCVWKWILFWSRA